MSVMVESVGKRSARWKHIKRDEFLRKEAVRTGIIRSKMPRSIVRQDNRFQHSISNLSSSSGYSSTGESGEEDKKKRPSTTQKVAMPVKNGGSGQSSNQQKRADNMFHDYHAQPLPDPKLDSVGSAAGNNSITGNSSKNVVAGKYIDTASPSSDEEQLNQLQSNPPTLELNTDQSESPPLFARVVVETKDMKTAEDVNVPVLSAPTNDVGNIDSKLKIGIATNKIAQKGGIFHNIRPHVASANEPNPRLMSAPATQLPPFTGLGKSVPKAVDRNVSVSSPCVVASRTDLPEPANVIYSSAVRNSSPQPMNVPVEAQPILSNSSEHVTNLIGADNDRASEDLAATQIQAFYHVNEDDMLLTDDVLMCPFIFRTQDAVLCGALAECVMPGMLRAQFSNRNKLLSLEMVYDAMGFMQQLGRASGNEAVAEIIPNSLEMSLQPSTDEARVITEAKAPYSIVSVNSLWTKLTKYTQLDVEKKDISILEGKNTNYDGTKRQGKPSHTPTDVAQGRAACSTNEFYDKFGNSFVAFVASYPLTK
jgi:hypothetical protein